jgi:hypothetical protein
MKLPRMLVPPQSHTHGSRILFSWPTLRQHRAKGWATRATKEQCGLHGVGEREKVKLRWPKNQPALPITTSPSFAKLISASLVEWQKIEKRNTDFSCLLRLCQSATFNSALESNTATRRCLALD